MICEGVSSRLEPILEWGRRTTIEEGSRLPVRAGFAGPTYINTGVIEFTAMSGVGATARAQMRQEGCLTPNPVCGSKGGLCGSSS